MPNGMTVQRISSDGEHSDPAPVEGRVIARITVNGTTYTATCTSEEQARSWLRRMATERLPVRQKEGATR